MMRLIRSTSPTTNTTPDTVSTHRVLFIPELLDIIFNFLDRSANIANACVCKQWSNIALDVLWKDVDNILHLFRLLKPIIHQDDGFEYCFASLPEVNDWSRFEKYASRVRSLKFRPAMYDLEICALLDDVARTRTSLEILPNMHTLEYIYTSNAHMERCKLFLHRRLRQLTVTAPFDFHPTFYTDLCARAPLLHSLTLYVHYPGKPIDAELRILLQNLPELKRIVLPEFHYTSSIIEQLSQAKNISVIDFSQDLQLGYGNKDNVASFSPLLHEGAFPSLRELNLSARIDDLDRFFRTSFAPTQITTLYINTYIEHTPTEVHTFLTLLSKQCHLLSKLSLQLYHRSLPIDLAPDQQLSYDTIKPLLAFPNLVYLELVHKLPLRITLDEIEDLARQWPHIEHLMLNCEPLFLSLSGFSLDLRAYLAFARHCPRLGLLGLYIDASQAGIPPSEDPIPSFKALGTLSIGTSRVHDGDTDAVATYLSRICPAQCRFEMGITWTEFGCEDHRYLPAPLRHLLQKRCSAWQAVERLLPALIQLRREERDRSRALQEEVEDLRVRNRLLMDKTDTKTRDSCVIA